MKPQDEQAQARKGTPGDQPVYGPDGVDGADSAGEPMDAYVFNRLQTHIESLRADQRPPNPGPLAEDEADAYRMAALFRAAVPHADEPDPAFVSQLRERLRREVAPSRDRQPPASPAPARTESRQRDGGTSQRDGLSRRGILASGLGIAASLAAGVAAGAIVETHMAGSPPKVDLVPSGGGTWVA